jgi:hypothetical protein
MIPQLADGFAFMYSIQDPRGGQVNSGGAVQILAIESNYLCRTFPDTDKFWASRQQLAIIHWGKTNLKIRPCLLSPSAFLSLFKRVIKQRQTSSKDEFMILSLEKSVNGIIALKLGTVGEITSVHPKQQQEYYLIYRFLTRVGRF